MTTRKPLLAITAALLALGTGGCSRSDPEPAPSEMPGEEASATVREPVDTPPPTLAPEPAPTMVAAPSVDTNAALEAPPEVAPAPDEQVMDDASATGMTARTSRNEPTSDAGEPVEQK